MDAKMEEGQPSASASLSATNKVERFVGLVRTAKTDDEVVELIMAATSEPGVIAFQELIELPQVQSLQNSANSSCKAAYRLLLVFAYGTWSSYLREQAQLPSVSPDHQLKLKQLSVITLAEKSKILPYELLMSELGLGDVRELEDFIINHCIYAGSISAKLDQKQRYLEVSRYESCHTQASFSRVRRQVENAAGRDLRPGQLEDMIDTLSNWMTISSDLLTSIQGKLDWANETSNAKKAHQIEVSEKIDEVKKSIRTELDIRQDTVMAEQSPGCDAMDEDPSGSARSKRRR